MSDNIKNMAASVKARLKNIAKEENINFNQILLLYFQERLLYRISISSYKNKFFLKGGLLILSMTEFKTRPTKDIDFLARGVSNDREDIKNLFREVCDIKVNDGVTFASDTIAAERITEGAEYQGIRIKVKGFLGNARRILQLDIGFSDIIIPKPQTMDYPVFLDDQKRPKIKTYSLESVIAEKFEAMLRLSMINSRMKDFYDIYIISGIKDFDGRVLQEAIFSTVQKRGTPLETNPAVFTKKFIDDKTRLRRWEGYLKRIGKASKRLSDEIIDVFPDVPWKQIKGMRDVLIHQYGDIMLGIVWETVKKRIPEIEHNLHKIQNIIERVFEIKKELPEAHRVES